MFSSKDKWLRFVFKFYTLRLMSFKYGYYIMCKVLEHDRVYDTHERTWFQLGRKLGILTEEQTSPCIDFDFAHPMARRAEKYAKAYFKRFGERK